tara:strand:- start:115 stop:1587 length:1473 start_codon:yes stop_codon:yes gene_type:complete
MKPNLIYKKYGQQLEPIFSVGAGYQGYFPKSGRQSVTVGNLREDIMGKKDTQILFYESKYGDKENATKVEGFYPGNYILSQRYLDTDAGYLTTSEKDSFISNFKTTVAGKAGTLLNEYTDNIQPDFKGLMPRALKTAQVDAGEEQYKVVGGEQSPQGKFGAKNIDMVKVPGLGNVQVTTSKLTHKGHHGLYGKHHTNMQTKITTAKKNFKKHGNEEKLYKDIARAGLTYFRNSITTWNKALASVKKELENASIPVNEGTMSREIRDIKSDTKYDRTGDARRAISRMSTSAAHFQTAQASKIVLQALGNLQHFGDTGVMYSYQLEPYVYAAFGQFIMDEASYQFDRSKLDTGLVMSGVYDMTDMQYDMVGSVQQVAMSRAFAHTAFSVQGVEGKTELNALNTGHAGGQFGNHIRFMSSIDFKHASDNMHQAITQGIIPEVKKVMDKAGKKYSSSRLTQFNTKVPFMPNKAGWALPYITIFDTELEKFGVQR